MMLDEIGAGAQASRIVLERGITGRAFVEIVRSTEGSAALQEDFGIRDRIARIQLQTTVKNEKQDKEENNKSIQDNSKKAPEFPNKSKGLPDIAEFKRYGVAIRGWLSLGSRRMAAAAEIIFKDPRVDLTTVASRLSSRENKVDAIWANEIMRMANTKTMAYLEQKDKHTLNNERSGLQIIKTLGTIIKGMSTRKLIKVTEEFVNAEPVRHESMLFDALVKWDSTTELLEAGNVAVSNLMKYNSMIKMMEKLTSKRSLNVHLALPMAMSEREAPGDYEQLRKVIDSCAYEFYSQSDTTADSSGGPELTEHNRCVSSIEKASVISERDVDTYMSDLARYARTNRT